MLALVVPVGADWYGLPLDQVREVLAIPSITPVPTAPRSLLGVCNLRGQILPVLDTANLLDLPPLGEGPYIVVIEGERGIAAIIASGMPESHELDAPADGDIGRATRAIYRLEDRLVALLDVESLLSADSIEGRSLGRIGTRT